MNISRRQLFKLCAGAVATTTIASLATVSQKAWAQAREFKLTAAKETRNTCSYCSVGCGTLLYSTGATGGNIKQKVFHVEGDPDHPVSRGALCPKGAGLAGFVNSEQRLKFPEYRAPGSDKWQRLTWDEAFSRISKLMKQDRDANLVKTNDKGTTVNRWLTTGMLCASAESNENGWLTQKFARGLGIVPVDTQARV